MFGCTDFHTHPVTDEFRNAVTELGIDPTEEQIRTMAAGALNAWGGPLGSAKVLQLEDVINIYHMAK